MLGLVPVADRYEPAGEFIHFFAAPALIKEKTVWLGKGALLHKAGPGWGAWLGDIDEHRIVGTGKQNIIVMVRRGVIFALARFYEVMQPIIVERATADIVMIGCRRGGDGRKIIGSGSRVNEREANQQRAEKRFHVFSQTGAKLSGIYTRKKLSTSGAAH